MFMVGLRRLSRVEVSLFRFFFLIFHVLFLVVFVFSLLLTLLCTLLVAVLSYFIVSPLLF